ncbi:hypothetical protein [uncultured Polaribacter sp.]|uniref:hypothetical protein n=1 Tax=uncultured Polaribacter sp. TaxID=174711 RepID=UPI00261E23B5|nr:hypothetical protein [uncultured Polaribacter sp.]
MKKIIYVFVFLLAVSFSAEAQRKGKKVSIEKQVERTLKKMSADLELSTAQQNEIRPLLAIQIADRNEMVKNRKDLKDSGEKPSREQMQKMRTERQHKIAEMNKKMKSILSKSQYVAFEKMQKERKEKNKKRNNN